MEQTVVCFPAAKTDTARGIVSLDVNISKKPFMCAEELLGQASELLSCADYLYG